MLRVVVIHQLVLSLIVGPMLCCCTTSRLGHDETVRTTMPVERPNNHSCCGHTPTPKDSGSPKHGENQPAGPAKCPCKGAPAPAATAPPSTLASADSLSILAAEAAQLDLPAPLFDCSGRVLTAPRFDHRTSSLSTSELLYAHHNLRC
jgi:hypothetical protein